MKKTILFAALALAGCAARSGFNYQTAPRIGAPPQWKESIPAGGRWDCGDNDHYHYNADTLRCEINLGKPHMECTGLQNDCEVVQTTEPPELTPLGCFLWKWFPPERLLDGPGTKWGREPYDRSCRKKQNAGSR